jgi:GAF domain-containing protein
MRAYDELRTAQPTEALRNALLQSYRPLIVHDLQTDERFSERERAQFRAAGYRAAIIVLMRWEDDHRTSQ